MRHKPKIEQLADLQLAALGLASCWNALRRIETATGKELDNATAALEELLSTKDFNRTGVVVTASDLRVFLKRAEEARGDRPEKDKTEPCAQARCKSGTQTQRSLAEGSAPSRDCRAAKDGGSGPAARKSIGGTDDPNDCD